MRDRVVGRGSVDPCHHGMLDEVVRQYYYVVDDTALGLPLTAEIDDGDLLG